jgi:hypothetical protein
MMSTPLDRRSKRGTQILDSILRTPLHDPPLLSLDLGDSSEPRWFLTWLPQKAVVGPRVGEGGAS